MGRAKAQISREPTQSIIGLATRNGHGYEETQTIEPAAQVSARVAVHSDLNANMLTGALNTSKGR